MINPGFQYHSQTMGRDAYKQYACGNLALALHEHTGLPLVLLSSDPDHTTWVHAAVMDGKDIIDADGRHSAEEERRYWQRQLDESHNYARTPRRKTPSPTQLSWNPTTREFLEDLRQNGAFDYQSDDDAREYARRITSGFEDRRVRRTDTPTPDQAWRSKMSPEQLQAYKDRKAKAQRDRRARLTEEQRAQEAQKIRDSEEARGGSAQVRRDQRQRAFQRGLPQALIETQRKKIKDWYQSQGINLHDDDVEELRLQQEQQGIPHQQSLITDQMETKAGDNPWWLDLDDPRVSRPRVESSRLPNSPPSDDPEMRERWHRRQIKEKRYPNPRAYIGPGALGEPTSELIRDFGRMPSGTSGPRKIMVGPKMYVMKGWSRADDRGPRSYPQAMDTTDHEYLWHHVAEAFGAQHPDVILSPRSDDKRMDLVYVEGMPPFNDVMQIAGGGKDLQTQQDRVRRAVMRPGGRQIALFHAAAGQGDHFANNWGTLAHDGSPITWDHEDSYLTTDINSRKNWDQLQQAIQSGRPLSKEEEGLRQWYARNPVRRTYPSSDFTIAHGLTGGDRLQQGNDITYEEYRDYGMKLQGLRSKFAKRGRTDWHDELMERWRDMWQHSQHFVPTQRTAGLRESMEGLGWDAHESPIGSGEISHYTKSAGPNLTHVLVKEPDGWTHVVGEGEPNEWDEYETHAQNPVSYTSLREALLAVHRGAASIPMTVKDSRPDVQKFNRTAAQPGLFGDVPDRPLGETWHQPELPEPHEPEPEPQGPKPSTYRKHWNRSNYAEDYDAQNPGGEDYTDEIEDPENWDKTELYHEHYGDDNWEEALDQDPVAHHGDRRGDTWCYDCGRKNPSSRMPHTNLNTGEECSEGIVSRTRPEESWLRNYYRENRKKDAMRSGRGWSRYDDMEAADDAWSEVEDHLHHQEHMKRHPDEEIPGSNFYYEHDPMYTYGPNKVLWPWETGKTYDYPHAYIGPQTMPSVDHEPGTRMALGYGGFEDFQDAIGHNADPEVGPDAARGRPRTSRRRCPYYDEARGGCLQSWMHQGDHQYGDTPPPLRFPRGGSDDIEDAMAMLDRDADAYGEERPQISDEDSFIADAGESHHFTSSTTSQRYAKSLSNRF